MNNTPLASVVLANYNGSQFLKEAIESVCAQSFRDFEFIVVDDGSTDNSRAIMDEMAARDSRIVRLYLPQNGGLPNALNAGIKEAKGKYIVRMDGDDICLPQRFERQVAYMERAENEKVGVCGTFCEVIDTSGKSLGPKRFAENDKDIRRMFWFRNPIQHSTSIIRKKCFEELGGYDTNFPQSQDYELWFRFGQKYELHNLPEILLKYRVHGENAILKRQKSTIRGVLLARKYAVTKYGYKMPFSGRVFSWLTNVTYVLPARLVFVIFQWMQK